MQVFVQTYTMKNLFATLPSEIVDIILEYLNYHRWRNGKFMRQLYLEDEKYDELKRKPLIYKNMFKAYVVSFTKTQNNKQFSYSITSPVCNNKIHWCMNIISVSDVISDVKHGIGITYHYIVEYNDMQNLSVIKFGFS